jgi:outer membrane protein OmpA-like peptidoglycan-associated protein
MQIHTINIKTAIMKTIVFSFVFLWSSSMFAQIKSKNLVPNPSFEIHRGKSNVIKNAIPWQNEGTVDYFMKPEKKDTSRFKGAHTGTCYAGLRFQAAYKEYMYVQLTEVLEKGRTYHFRMYVRLLSESTVTVKQLGVYFSDEKFKTGMVFDEEGLIDSTYKKGISGEGWMKIQGNYIAMGGEKYIILGNFSNSMKAYFEKKHKWDLFGFKEAYYYIDDVSLYKRKMPSDSSNIAKANKKTSLLILPKSFTAGEIIQLKNLQFEKGTAKFQKSSIKIVDELARVMNNHPFMEIQINGYTDNKGNEVNNKKISKERAKAVYDYLISQGVISPMTYKGFGQTQPIAPNDNDENRAKNNRIEVLILKETIN